MNHIIHLIIYDAKTLLVTNSKSFFAQGGGYLVPIGGITLIESLKVNIQTIRLHLHEWFLKDIEDALNSKNLLNSNRLGSNQPLSLFKMV